MSKAILMSIQPKWVCEILNGNKTIEIRKKFPENYVGWVYIYCTKDKKYANLINRGGFLTGMVVARFWCDKVDEISCYGFEDKKYLESTNGKTCLTYEELTNYLNGKVGYGIHISKLEIFDKPKELSEFVRPTISKNKHLPRFVPSSVPQSWCYTEISENKMTKEDVLEKAFHLKFVEYFDDCYKIYQSNFVDLWINEDEKVYRIYANGLDKSIEQYMRDDQLDCTSLSNLEKINWLVNKYYIEMKAVARYMEEEFKGWKLKDE